MSVADAEETPMSEIDNTTINGAATPPTTVDGDLSPSGDMDSNEKCPPPLLSFSSVPSPGSTVIIRLVNTGHLLTLREGHVILAPASSPASGSIHWQCVEVKGWLAFRNVASGRYLGRDWPGNLICTAEKQLTWENFCVHILPNGNYNLFLDHGKDQLWKVGVKDGNGERSW